MKAHLVKLSGREGVAEGMMAFRFGCAVLNRSQIQNSLRFETVFALQTKLSVVEKRRSGRLI